MEQPGLFVAEALPQYLPDTQDIRDRLQSMLDKMRAAASWPWKAATVAHYRETVWPSLLSKLTDGDEGIRLRSEMAAEISRLDAAV